MHAARQHGGYGKLVPLKKAIKFTGELMKAMNQILILMVLLGTSAMAETYKCNQYTVVTDSDSGIQINGRHMTRIGNDNWILGYLYTFQFNVHYVQGVVKSAPTLSERGQVILCK